MPELARKVWLWRLSHPRALAPLLAGAIGAIAVIALLTPSGHGGAQPPVPPGQLPIAHSPHGACAPGSSRASIGTVTSAAHAQQSGLDGVLDAALRAARRRTRAPA